MYLRPADCMKCEGDGIGPPEVENFETEPIGRIGPYIE